jgi:ABC-type multidrug transport system ATPase subunit
MNLIFTSELTKQFGTLTAVDRLNWSVPEGSLCGLLGPNGAGKTTTLKMLLGMIHPTSGSGRVLDLNIENQSLEIRRFAAFVTEDKDLYDSMKVGSLIRFYSSFFPDWSEGAIDEMMKAWNLNVDQRVCDLSRGTRAKLYLALSIARRPRVLMLDEPTEGLDPVGQEEVLELLTHWLTRGQRSAVIASHRLEEIERVCDRVAILNQGRLLLEDDLDQMKSTWKTIEVIGDFVPESPVVQVTKSGMVSRIVTNEYESFLKDLQHKKVTPLHVYDMNLRDIYLASLQKSSHATHGTGDRLEDWLNSTDPISPFSGREK